MIRELVIDVSSSEIYISLLENKNLVELNKDKLNTKFSVGDIYLGRIKKLMPGLNAAFVDIGYEKDAFLHYFDLGPQFQTLNKFIHQALSPKQKFPNISYTKPEEDINKDGKISDVLSVGQYVLVQIAKEPISSKGPRLSAEISIPGRNLVLIPFSDKTSISQKIKTQEEKSRLKNLLNSIVPRGYGIIVRTVAESKKVADLDSELKRLIEAWESSVKKIRGITPPKLILGELNRTSAILRDVLNESFNNIHVNDLGVYNEIVDYIKEIAPAKEKIVKHYTENQPIFEHFGVEKQIKALFGKTVGLKAGAYLIIEHTEALHVVDVNSGNRSKKETDQETNALETNLIAVDEIARQLKLRDMGGIIVIDFIDMQLPENKQRIFDKMRDAMASDRAKHQILPLSKFCLMQITRQRVRPETHISTSESCPTCRGTGEVTPSIVFTDELENALSYTLAKVKDSTVTLKVHPFIKSHLKEGIFNIHLKWMLKYKRRIKIKSISSYNYLEYHFYDSMGEEIFV
ncbi:MAG TPA: ribonuclease E/G [Bacteroidales bacterium]|nr:ribonuclease E/G [Bacteroidales bacterium]